MTGALKIDEKILKRIKWEACRSDLSDQDLASMAQLAHRVQPGSSLSDIEKLRWQYLENPAGRAVVWLAKDKGSVIGQVAFLPVKIWLEGRERSAAYAANILTDVNHRNKGVFALLAQKAVLDLKESGASLFYGLPNPYAYPTWIKRVGVEYVGDIPDYLKLINPKKILSKTVGNPVLLGIMSLVSKIVFSLKRPAISPDIAIKEIFRFDDDFDMLWERNCRKIKNSIIRRSRHLNWRYFSCPGRNYKVFSAYKNSGLLAYTVLRMIGDASANTGWIIDMCADKTDDGEKALRSLVGYSEKYLVKNGADIVRAAVSGSPACKNALRKNGFLRAPRLFKPWPIKVIMLLLNMEKGKEPVFDSFLFTLGDNDSP